MAITEHNIMSRLSPYKNLLSVTTVYKNNVCPVFFSNALLVKHYQNYISLIYLTQTLNTVNATFGMIFVVYIELCQSPLLIYSNSETNNDVFCGQNNCIQY